MTTPTGEDHTMAMTRPAPMTSDEFTAAHDRLRSTLELAASQERAAWLRLHAALGDLRHDLNRLLTQNGGTA